MASLFGGLINRVVKVKIQGTINQQTTQRIFNGLVRSKIIKPKALAIVINSSGGSLSQTKNISDLLKNYGEKHNIPIYGFAQDQCLGSANILLTTGVKAYATEMSMLGDFGFSWSSLWFKNFSKKYNIGQQFIYHGKNKVKFNPFEDLQPQSQKWMQNYLYLLEHDLKLAITQNRQSHFRKRQLSKEDIQQKIFKGLTLKPQLAIQNGFIDGYKTFDELMNTNFSGTKVFEINKPKAYWRMFRNYAVQN